MLSIQSLTHKIVHFFITFMLDVILVMEGLTNTFLFLPDTSDSDLLKSQPKNFFDIDHWHLEECLDHKVKQSIGH